MQSNRDISVYLKSVQSFQETEPLSAQVSFTISKTGQEIREKRNGNQPVMTFVRLRMLLLRSRLFPGEMTVENAMGRKTPHINGHHSSDQSHANCKTQEQPNRLKRACGVVGRRSSEEPLHDVSKSDQSEPVRGCDPFRASVAGWIDCESSQQKWNSGIGPSRRSVGRLSESFSLWSRVHRTWRCKRVLGNKLSTTREQECHRASC